MTEALAEFSRIMRNSEEVQYLSGYERLEIEAKLGDEVIDMVIAKGFRPMENLHFLCITPGIYKLNDGYCTVAGMEKLLTYLDSYL